MKDKNSQETSLADLPKEILLNNVLGQLPFSSRYTLRKVSKQFSTRISHRLTDFVIRSYLIVAQPKEAMEAIRFIITYGPKIKYKPADQTLCYLLTTNINWDSSQSTLEKAKKIAEQEGVERFKNSLKILEYALKLHVNSLRKPTEHHIKALNDFNEVLKRASHLKGTNAPLKSFPNINLSSTKLKEANLEWAGLQGADLQGANLEGANLEGANLEGANLNRANLIRARLCGAHLERANLQDTWLQSTHLQSTHLKEAKLRGARLCGAHLEGANLQGADLEEANLEEANLEGANLNRANLTWANLIRARLCGAHLERANLQCAWLESTHLEGANLQGADLREAHLERANLKGANLRGARLCGAHLEGVDLEGADLEGVDLEGAYLESAIFIRANLKKVNWSCIQNCQNVSFLEETQRPEKLKDELDQFINNINGNLRELQLRELAIKRYLRFVGDLKDRKMKEVLLFCILDHNISKFPGNFLTVFLKNELLNIETAIYKEIRKKLGELKISSGNSLSQ